MGFRDIFRKSFINGFYNVDLDLPSILLSLAVVCLIVLYIF